MRRDVIVIGSGQAGVPLAVRLAGAGRSVVLAERDALGGTCVNTGCTPTKTFIASAQAAHDARRAGDLGVRIAGIEVDMGAVVDRKNALVRQWREGVETRLGTAGSNLELVRGHARFTGPRTIDIDGLSFEAETIIIDTGARPAVPSIDGLEAIDWLDNATAMDLRDVPSHLLVMGGGYIGCELGQAFRRLGARVTIVDRAPHLLAREDPDVSEALEEAFRKEAIELRLNVRVASVSPDGGGVRLALSDGDVLSGSHLLVATGRRPNSDDLGLAAAGIAVGDDGAIGVDDQFRTSSEGVYAVGDVTGGPQFTHMAWDDHRILFDLLVGRGRRTRADRLVPYAAFTDPQVARVGLSERDATEQGIPYESATLPFETIARARETGRTAGLLKLLIDPSTEQVLGAAIVGAEAGELIHVFVALMAAAASVRVWVDAVAIHPTFAEGVHSLAMKLERNAP